MSGRLFCRQVTAMKKRILMMIGVFAAALMLLCSCGDSERPPSANYLSAVEAMTQAVKVADTEGYLMCFTEAARDKYRTGENYDPGLAGKITFDGETSRLLQYDVEEYHELNSSEISKVKEDHIEAYKRRLEITKAYELDITFTSGERTARRKLIVINNGVGWQICGDVIEQVFEGTADSSKDDSSESGGIKEKFGEAVRSEADTNE